VYYSLTRNVIAADEHNLLCMKTAQLWSNSCVTQVFEVQLVGV